LTSGGQFVALRIVGPWRHPGRFVRRHRVDAQAGTDQADNKPTYTTSKQVQAWFLGRSRDRWKNKATQKNAEIKRLRQRAGDVEASRADWRARAEAAR
jgi:hypothetical protein